MKRWTSTVLILSVLTLVLISCVAVLLIAGEPPDVKDDVPLHPVASSSYPNSSTTKSRRSHALGEQDNANEQHIYSEHSPPHLQEQRHNYRKRFTDAIKGVFSDLVNSSNNSSSPSPTLSSPTFEDHLATTADKESFENTSSRLKRQLDFGSASSEEQTTTENNSKERYRTTQPSAKKYTPSPKRPVLRIIKSSRGSSSTPKSPSSSSTSPPQSSTSSSEEYANSSEEQRGRKYQRKGIRRFRQNSSRRQPQLQSLSSREKYDVSQEESQDAPRGRKNFTLEVVQVERKVVRKEDGNIPPLYKKGNYNIEPRLLKVTKKEDANRPQVVYKNPRSNAPPATAAVPKASNRQLKSASREVSKEVTSETEAKGEKGDTSEERQPVLVKLHQQIPYNDHDLSDEDLKDYHDGHSTFGSKGNFTHTIISRNVAGFLPNESGESVSKNRKSDRKIVIEKGKVTERYPETYYENPNTDIYSVPGGRSSSTENSAPRQEAFPFTKVIKKKLGKTGDSKELQDNDRTSPAIPYSLAELHRKGHPGVVPAPKTKAYRSHPLSEPYGESAVFSSPFKYNPLEDDPPLKFDPESDRFYGEPVPDSKERVAQSNSPVQVENRDSREDPQTQEFFSPIVPKKRGSEENIGEQQTPSREDDQSGSKEASSRNNRPDDRYFYDGRAYSPPDYAAEYDTEPARGGGGGNTRDNDDPSFDFTALDDNFGPNPDAEDRGDGPGQDFFEFPEGLGAIGGGRGGGSRFTPRAGSDEGRENKSEEEEERGGSDNERAVYEEGQGATEREEQPVRRPKPPQPPPRRDRDSEYEANNDYRFGPGQRRDVEDTEGHPEVYDSGFVRTLKEFDEEIKKLQEEERQKLLQSTPHPEQERSTEQDHPPPPRSTTSGYNKDPPLVITSPGPLEPSSFDSPAVGGGGGPPVSRQDVGATIRVTDEEDEDDVTERNRFINSREPIESREDLGDTTPPNRITDGDEEEEETATNRSFGGNDYSTENTGEVDDEKRK